MFVIDLKSADGSTLPYQLSIEPYDHARVQFQVMESSKVMAQAILCYEKVPLRSSTGDVRVGNMELGYEPMFGQLLVEFGDDPRLGVIRASEVQSALNVCRCYDSVMKN